MSGTVEGKVVTTVNNGTNNTAKAKGDMITTGQQVDISNLSPETERMQKNRQKKIMEHFGLM